MRLTKKDYFEIYTKFGYIIDILYHSSGALYLKDLCKYTHKSNSQTSKDVVKLEELELIRAEKINNEKIICLRRKAYRGFYDKDVTLILNDEAGKKLKENNLKACIYHNYDISRNEEIKKYLYKKYFDLNTISKDFKDKNNYIFDYVFDNDIVNFYQMNKNNYKVVIRAYQLDFKTTKEVIGALESIYHLFYTLELNDFKCEVTVVTAYKLNEQNKKYFFTEVFRHKTKVDYLNNQRKFLAIFKDNFRKKIILKSYQELELSTSN